MRAFLFAIVLLVASCATVPEPKGVGCPKLSEWSASDQRLMLKEMQATPQGSYYRRVVADLQYMRDQSRACAGAAVPR